MLGETPTTLEGGLDVAFCMGYMAGAIDSFNFWKALEKTSSLPHFCIPEEGIQSGQVWRVLKKYLDNNPEKLHQRADFLIYFSLLEAFPCK